MANKGRQRPDWDEYFMFQAYWAATRSSCLHLQTGAVIVKDKRIIASGYNGAPPGIKNCLEVGCRKDAKGIAFDDKGKGVCRGLHGEYNAMAQISRLELQGTRLYTVYLPCSMCAKQIVGSGIRDVFYSKIYKEEDILTQELFEESKTSLTRLDLNLEKYFEMIRYIKNQKV